jgi:hypothetical protein
VRQALGQLASLADAAGAARDTEAARTAVRHLSLAATDALDVLRRAEEAARDAAYHKEDA